MSNVVTLSAPVSPARKAHIAYVTFSAKRECRKALDDITRFQKAVGDFIIASGVILDVRDVKRKYAILYEELRTTRSLCDARALVETTRRYRVLYIHTMVHVYDKLDRIDNSAPQW